MAKQVNYTPEQVETLMQGYNPELSYEERTAQVEALAMQLGKNKQSIVSKLSSMKVYVPKTYVTKTGGESVSKDDLSDRIALAMGENAESFETLAKANKAVLQKIWNFVKPEPVADSESSEDDASEAETA